MFLILLIIIILLLIIYNFYKYLTIWRYIEKIPGPRTYPFVGNIFQIGLNPAEYLKSLFGFWKQFDYDKFRIWFGPHYYVVLTKPEDVEVVLSSTTLTRKNDVYELLYPWLGDGLLVSYGEKWFKRRKLITPSFHFKILNDFLDVINSVSTRFLENLKSKASTEEIFDIQSMVHYCTLDIICETAMGIQVNATENHNSKIVSAFQDACYLMQNRMFSVLKRINFFYKFTSDSVKHDNAIKILKDFNNEVIEKRRKILENSVINANNNQDGIIKPKKAFLDTLLTSTIDGHPLKSNEISEEVSTFAFEGHDTTTSGVMFAIFALSRHPEIQEKAYEEQLNLFNDDMSRDPTFQEVNDMKYLEMIIKESQRLYPSVPMIGRVTEQNTEINGKIIPRGTGIIIFIIAMGYNEKYFPNPYKFDPERFNLINRENTNPYSYVPFSAGPRNCIGQKFAMMEMKVILSKIIRNFKILAPDESLNYTIGYRHNANINKYDIKLASVLTLKSDNGVYIKLRNRNVK